MKKSFEIKIPENEKYINVPQLQYSNRNAENIFNLEENNLLLNYKNKIDEIEYKKSWDYFKKFSNDYELLHISNSKHKFNNSISSYTPLSRSYFKLLEMVKDYNLLDYNYNIKTSHIAEGPGGFIEAVINIRKKMRKYNDKIYGITLKNFDKNIPGWKKAERFLKMNSNIKIIYGKDNTGNIYNLENIIDFKNKIGFNSCEFITADGGFDYSINFNQQEQLSYQLIFCEIVCALSVQKIKGTFICKFFDTYTPLTIKYLWILNIFYESIIITKPLTSRPANSEKYIIAKNFKGITNYFLKELYTIVYQWEQNKYNNKEKEVNFNYFINKSIENKNKNEKENKTEKYYKISNNYIIDFTNINISDNYYKIITQYNTYYIYSQLQNIIKTLSYIKNNINDEDKHLIIKNQIKKSIEWCNKYNTDINYKSNYIKNYN
jgi:23S rRNA U2552 (ribose-2'-O)-methylase RlmE/FtsJ